MRVERLVIKDGKIQSIYSDALRPILRELGKLEIKRASHVEPNENGEWVADMSPVEFGVKLGPFELREDALKAEVEWLQARLSGGIWSTWT